MSQLFRMEPFWRVILRELELSAESLARRAGLPANLFASDLVFVDLEGWSSLWEALELECREPGLALRLGQELTFDMFDPALFAALCSENLYQAAARLQLYKQLVGPCRLKLHEGDGLGLSCEVVGLPLPPALWGATELVLWVGLVRHTTRHHVVPKRVTMPTQPEDPALFASFFGVPVSIGSGYELVFAGEDAKRVFLTTDSSMWVFFEPMLRHRLVELDERTQMAERVSAALFELLPSGRCQIGDVSQALGVSTRTIQRRLGQEDTTFSNVLDQTRTRLARFYLTQTKMAIAEVAFLIGYDDPNSFYPAFRSWTGMTPQAARDAVISD